MALNMMQAELHGITTFAGILHVPNVIDKLDSKSLPKVAGIAPLKICREALLTKETKGISFQSAPRHARVRATGSTRLKKMFVTATVSDSAMPGTYRSGR